LGGSSTIAVVDGIAEGASRSIGVGNGNEDQLLEFGNAQRLID
jgi:hypothetical protein